jgi:hypothetical protein
MAGRGKTPLPLTPQQQSSLQRLAASSKLTANEQAAIAGLLGLQFATARLDRQMINQAASLIHSSHLTQEESQVVRQSVLKAVASDVVSEQAETGGVGFMMADSSFSADMLSSFADSSDGDAFVEAGDDASEVFFADNDETDEDGANADSMQTCRYLRVINDIGEKLELHVQYRTLNSADEWTWYPADPVFSDRSVAYDLDPGEATYLADGNWKMNANRVRIWAVSASGKHYVQTKDQDLWLVPEFQGDQRSYSSPRVQTFTLALAP